MAAADKTYINKDQYILVKEWWLKTRKKQIRELGHEIYMYPFQYLEHITYENGYDNPTIHYKYDPSESSLDIENKITSIQNQNIIPYIPNDRSQLTFITLRLNTTNVVTDNKILRYP